MTWMRYSSLMATNVLSIFPAFPCAFQTEHRISRYHDVSGFERWEKPVSDCFVAA